MRALFYLLFLSPFFCNSQDLILNRDKLPKTLFFHDDFLDNSNQWNDFDHTEARSYIKQGKLFFENKLNDNDYRIWDNYSIDPNYNYYVEMEFCRLEGPVDYGNGLLFNHTDSKKGDEYGFIICSNQAFNIYGTIEGVNISIQDWSHSKYINIEGNNKLGMFAKNGKIYFYINDHLVYQMKRPERLGSNFGFIASHSTSIAIDKFSIRYNPLPFDVIEDAVQGYKKINLGSNINSELDDSSPVLSADGKTMYFTRSVNMGFLGLDQRTLMHSEYNELEKKWSLATPLPNTMNQGGTPQVIYISPDKNTMIINATYDSNGKFVKDEELSISHKIKNGWSSPEKIHIEGWENQNEYEEYSFSTTNKVMLLSIQTKQGYGERDIFVSFRNSNIWTKPKNIGSIVNSNLDDFSPCLAPDNVTLYYSSEGKSGYGKADIFVTRRLDDTWLNWSTPQNLGPEINTRFYDAGLQVDAFGQYAYLEDSKNEDKKGEINKIQIPESARPKPVIIVKGKVFNRLTNNPFSASIIYEDLDKKREEGTATSSPEDGSFVVILPYGVNYGLIACAKGFLSESKNIDIRDSIKNGSVEISIDLYLTPLAIGESLKLNTIFFEPDKFELLESSYLELDRLYNVMVQNNKLAIDIEGHTDSGGINSNLEELQILSLNRANSVRDYLIHKGIEENRVNTIGYGKSRPVSGNNKALNRRVEIKIIKL